MKSLELENDQEAGMKIKTKQKPLVKKDTGRVIP